MIWWVRRKDKGIKECPESRRELGERRTVVRMMGQWVKRVRNGEGETVLRGRPLEIELKIQKYRQGNRKDASGRQMLAIHRWVDARLESKTKEQKIDKTTVT